jgi:hypothetical protein
MKYTEMTKKEIVEYGTEVGVKLDKKQAKAKLIAQLKTYLSTLEAEESPPAKTEEVGDAKISSPTTKADAQYIKDVNRMLSYEKDKLENLIHSGVSDAIIKFAETQYEELCKKYSV